MRLWDLRASTTTPLAEFQGHTKGVLSVAWCPHDGGLLMSCAKGGRACGGGRSCCGGCGLACARV
jgi:protein transport protein SEC31